MPGISLTVSLWVLLSFGSNGLEKKYESTYEDFRGVSMLITLSFLPKLIQYKNPCESITGTKLETK